MLNDYIDIRKNEMIDKLIELVRFPSIAVENDGPLPCGPEVNNALNYYVELAKSMGFEAKNLGKCAEVRFGGEGKHPKKVYIANHLDVVPTGDGWTTDPYTLSIRDGKLYGRGVIDNKGPALAVLYALKAIKDLGLYPKAEIRLIAGGCEETSMSDLREYVAKNGLPDYGLTPDSSFPIINAEVGISFGKFHLKETSFNTRLVIESFSAGRAYNCVPDLCTAVLRVSDDFIQDVKNYMLAKTGSESLEYSLEGNTLTLTTFGKSAHGSVPDQGVNAAFSMLRLLGGLYERAGEENDFVAFGLQWFVGDTKGLRIGIACNDAQTGDLSLNVGMVEYSAATKKGFYSFDIRVPVTKSVQTVKAGLEAFAKETGAELELGQLEESTYMDPECEFLQKLAKCFTDITGKKCECLTARGCTYAKAFGGKGVAFGPIDEEDPSQGGGLHGIDEYISIDAYVNLAKIYALAIKELWT